MMMRALRVDEHAQSLSALLRAVTDQAGVRDTLVTGLALDSRQVQAGDLFLACAGSHSHGLMHLAEAVAAGAAAVVYDPIGAPAGALAGIERRLPCYAVDDLSAKLGPLAARFYGEPSNELTVIGVTGTNGKTSTTHFIAQALTTPNLRCGLIGTLGYGLYGALDAGAHTTPDAVELQRLLAMLRAQGTRYVAMEVSSHALAQGRVNGVRFALALWTQLSRDHLDYHLSMENYARAKRRLFEMPYLGQALINLDDAAGRDIIAHVTRDAEIIGYGFDPAVAGHSGRYVHGRELRLHEQGCMSMMVDSSWGEGELRAPLLGHFNAYNLLAACAALLALDIPLEQVLRRLADTQPVSGRMQCHGGGARPLIVIDYAHTPDALEQALAALRDHCRGVLWCVFGCGGERDAGKRALMGSVAERYADRVILTDDNPRREDPEHILDAIAGGLQHAERAVRCRPRAAAITYALDAAAPGDVVLIAGKGHESYQQIGDEKRPYSDSAEVRRWLETHPL